MEKDFMIREVCRGDFESGLIEVLSELTAVGNSSRESWLSFFSYVSANPYHKIWVVETEGRIVGTLTCLIEPKVIHDFGYVAHVEDVVVAKPFRGKRLVKKMLDQAVLFAREHKAYKVILDCKPGLVPMYKKYGFELVGACVRMDL